MTELRLPGRVLVRTNIDYSTMTMQAFAAQDDPTLPIPFIRFATHEHVLEAFNEVFGFDFFEFRAELRAIAEVFLKQIRGAALTTGFANFEDWFDSEVDEIIYPIDDDDIFHPELLTLASLTPDTTVVVWEHAAVGPPYGGLRPAVHHYDAPVLWTNNWGVKKSFLRSHFSRAEARQILSDHRLAQTRIGKLCGLSPSEEIGGFGPFNTPLESPFLRFVRGHFGMQYHHPASLVMLWCYKNLGGDLRENLQSIELQAPIRLPTSLAWAEDFVARCQELLTRLAATRARQREAAGVPQAGAPIG